MEKSVPELHCRTALPSSMVFYGVPLFSQVIVFSNCLERIDVGMEVRWQV